MLKAEQKIILNYQIKINLRVRNDTAQHAQKNLWQFYNGPKTIPTTSSKFFLIIACTQNQWTKQTGKLSKAKLIKNTKHIKIIRNPTFEQPWAMCARVIKVVYICDISHSSLLEVCPHNLYDT